MQNSQENTCATYFLLKVQVKVPGAAVFLRNLPAKRTFKLICELKFFAFIVELEVF